MCGCGWEIDGGDLWDVLECLDSEGCLWFVVIDIIKDGILGGFNLDLLVGVVDCIDVLVIVFGGVFSFDDLCVIVIFMYCGVEGVIVGKVFYVCWFILL